jgi:3-oxoadipate enol-lactonase
VAPSDPEPDALPGPELDASPERAAPRHGPDSEASPERAAAVGAATPLVVPPLPPGREVELPDGRVFVREVAGPAGAPVIVLLHGWTATADLNFFQCYEPLGAEFRVVAFDHRGHGRGLRSRRGFRLEDCADDVVAVADAIGVDRFVAVGYSMGGAIAQLLWHRHRERVAGLVLCATAPHFNRQRNERLSFLGLTGLAAVARFTPAQLRQWLTHQLYLQRKTSSWDPWAVQEAAGHDWRMVLEAGRALGGFRADEWLGDVDVPTSVVITMKDHVVPLKRQMLLFEEIPTAAAFRVDGRHDAAISVPERFVPTAVAAIHSVVERAT